MQPVENQTAKNISNPFRSNAGGNGCTTRGMFYYLCCFWCFLPLLITSFIMAMVARSRMLNMQGNFSGYVSNWQSDMIYAITTNTSIPLSSDQYITPWIGSWPGNIQGCYCAHSNWLFNVYAGLKTRPCNSNETIYGFCDNIYPQGPVELRNWIGNTSLFLVKTKGTSFLQNYDKMDASGNCKAGFTKCGNPGSKSKGICLPASIPTCPITKVSTTQFPNSQMNSFPNFTVYTSRDNSANPICEGSITESYLCYARSLYAVTPGRTRYPLLQGYWENCQKDYSAVAVSEVGEQDLFNWNNVPYQKLPNYGVNNNYKYDLMLVPYLEWDPACQKEVPNVLNMNQNSDSLVSSFFVLFVLYIISFIGSLICYMVAFVGLDDKSRKCIYSVVFGIRAAFFIMVLPSLIIVYKKAGELGDTFGNITSKNCSTDTANANFSTLYSNYDSKISDYCKWFLWLAIIGFIFEIITFIFIVFGPDDEGSSAGPEGHDFNNPSNVYRYQELDSRHNSAANNQAYQPPPAYNSLNGGQAQPQAAGNIGGGFQQSPGQFARQGQASPLVGGVNPQQGNQARWQ